MEYDKGTNGADEAKRINGTPGADGTTGIICADEARELLGRYFEGETSLHEEKALRRYFAGTQEIPAEMEYARAMFGYFDEAAGETYGRIFDAGTEITHDETTGARFRNPNADDATAWIPSQNRSLKHRARRIWAWAGSAAAVIAVAATVSITQFSTGENGETAYCYIDGKPITDFEVAYEYTRQALGILGDNMKKPKECLEPVERAGKSLESLRYLGLLDGLLSGGGDE